LSREEELNRANGDETKRKKDVEKEVEEGEKEKEGLRSDARQRRIRK